MKKIIIGIVTALAVLVGLSAAQANAVSTASTSLGGVVYNRVASNGKIVADDSGFRRDVWPGRSSEWVGIYDADYFWVPGGCDATSQWGHVYSGNRWYGPLPNDTNLSLLVDC